MKRTTQEINEVATMKLIGNLKDQVETANSKEEAKEIIEKAGMELTEEEVEMVTGGGKVKFPSETKKY